MWQIRSGHHSGLVLLLWIHLLSYASQKERKTQNEAQYIAISEILPVGVLYRSIDPGSWTCCDPMLPQLLVSLPRGALGCFLLSAVCSWFYQSLLWFRSSLLLTFSSTFVVWLISASTTSVSTITLWLWWYNITFPLTMNIEPVCHRCQPRQCIQSTEKS